MSFSAGIIFGFLLRYLMTYNFCRKTGEIKNKNLALTTQNERLIRALRESGARISFYKNMNKSHLKKILAYENQKQKLMSILRGLEDK